MLEYIKANICDVDEIEVLQTNQFRTVHLVNNKLVVMSSANAKLIFNWYMDNQNFAPATIFGYDECICYDYLVPTSEYLKKQHLIDFIKCYRPKLVAISDVEYYEALEEKYKSNCLKLNISPSLPKRPNKEGLYQLHGNMDINQTIVFDNKIILLDPRPITGALLYDVMNMYLSSFEVMEMFTQEQIATVLNCELSDIEYYSQIVLVNRLINTTNCDPKVYDKYLALLTRESKS